MSRSDGRANDQLRPVEIITDYTENPAGSVLIRMGRTWVLCAASVEDGLPAWLRSQGGQGWITSEYAMLPHATDRRATREITAGKISGRSQEIQRLIGRALRAAVDLTKLGERTITIDCDVLQADGGTRTAAITGGYVALSLALRRLRQQGLLKADPLQGAVAAVSVGIVDGEARLDLAYEEDRRAEVDLNIVMRGADRLVEVQGTAEGKAFSRAQLNAMLDLADKGISELFARQAKALGG